MVKTKKILCVGFSIAALAMVGVYIASIIFNSPCLHTITTRHDLLQAAILALPFIELLTFVLIESKLVYINKRWFVWSLFATYFAFIIMFDFMGHGMPSPTFLNNALNHWETVVAVVTGVRVFLVFVIPFAHRWLVKAYSLGMTGFLCVSFMYLLENASWLQGLFFRYAIAVIADILFHSALFFFADVMTKENGWFSDVGFFGSLLDQTNKYSEEDEATESVDRPISVDYKLVCMYAASKEFNNFVQTDMFFRRLAEDLFWDENGTYYSVDQYRHHITTLRQIADDLNEQWVDYIHRGFIDMLNLLLIDENAYTFIADVVSVSRLFFNQSISSWTAAMDAHDRYMEFFLENQGG